MMKNSIFKGKVDLRKAVPLALLFLQGTQVMAAGTEMKTEGTTVLEILGYIAMIVGLVVFAWFFGSWQSKGSGPEASKPHKHFEHPNDPHFRKLKKKTH